jgi:hypothetical protein
VETLRYVERRMVGQHDAAGADPDALRHGRDLADHDVGRGARDGGQIMMLGDPIAGVAEAIGEPGEIEAVAQRGGTGAAGGHRRKVENR